VTQETFILPRRRKTSDIEGQYDATPPTAADYEDLQPENEAPPVSISPEPEESPVTESEPLIAPRPRSKSETLLDAYDQLADAPVKDRNGSLKSAVLQAFHQMGENADAQLQSGRPMDMYGIASILGGGGGGFFAGAAKPELDENRKRQVRMADLGIQIRQQLAVEQAATRQQQVENQAAEAQRRDETQRLGIEARNKPKPFIIAGKRINYKKNDEGDWEPYEESVDGQPLEDKSKTPDEDGILPSQNLRAKLTREEIEARKQIAVQNNQFKQQESQKNRDEKAREANSRNAVSRAALSERIAARLEADKRAKVSQGLEVKRIKISYAKAKIEAEKEGVDIDQYIDALSDNGVVVEK
jgi:hypothetical protein